MVFDSKKFIFNGIASDRFNLVICEFNANGGVETSSTGSTIELRSTKSPLGNKWNFLGYQYTEQITFNLTVCKKDGDIFNLQELSSISRWLIRKDGFKEIQFDSVTLKDTIFFANATKIDKITSQGRVVGLTITFVCNAPFGFSPEKRFNKTTASNNSSFKIIVNSDEIGEIYPHITIKINAGGKLSIKNKTSNDEFTILNCSKDEVITIDGENKQISSSLSNHSIYDNFNWNWIRFIRTDDIVQNEFEVSLPCELLFKYRLVRKVGV